MEVQPAQPPSAAFPRWVLLEESGGWVMADGGDGSPASACSTADAQTMATARTSTGDQIRLHLRLAEPPMVSGIACAKFPNGGDPYSTIVASHGDSMLVKQPHHATGMLRRGEDEFVMAELMMVGERVFSQGPETAELLLFRSGEWSWSIMCPQIINYGSRDFGELSSSWTTDTVVTIADRLLCWVDLSCGILFCDVFDESPVLQFQPLPKDPCHGRASNRDVCAIDCGAALKLVNIFPRCCCGGKGATLTGCLRSLNAYTINTWTLRVSDMEWVKDGMFHNTELWGLDAYYDERLPRLVPTYPVVSMDEPHTISFLLRDEDGYDPWLITVDMKSKTLRSATQNFRGSWGTHGRTLIPSSLSYYLNSSPSCISNVNLMGQSHIEKPQMAMVDEQVRDYDVDNLTMQSSCQPSTEPAVQASEILAALEEIPTYGLDDDMLKAAYRILRRDDGRRFRSLLSVPMNLMKDWLLMEIETSED
ncbi:unnamed protein product [Urochloa decumbens]|uniref:DUF1618 domain-containing protein n=1 Tax=Urochloa decumbens TaxID=240449 RepID=A0ABC9AL96_9POAL